MSFDSAAALAVAARWSGFAATFFVIGACTFRYGVLRSVPASLPFDRAWGLRRAADLGVAASLVLAAALLLKLYAQARSLLDPGDSLSGDLLKTILRQTTWGRGWLAQITGAGLAFLGFAVARLGAAWIPAAVGGLAVVLAAPLTGHAVGSERAGAWAYPLDVLHVLAGGCWLGTLAVLVTAGFAGVRRATGEVRLEAAAVLVNAFSPIALLSAGLAVAAGAVLGFQYLEGSLGALFASGYGRTLLIKTFVLAGVAGLGAWNWRIQRGRLDAASGLRGFRRTSGLELALGGILLAVTAVLVALPMPGE